MDFPQRLPDPPTPIPPPAPPRKPRGPNKPKPTDLAQAATVALEDLDAIIAAPMLAEVDITDLVADFPDKDYSLTGPSLPDADDEAMIAELIRLSTARDTDVTISALRGATPNLVLKELRIVCQTVVGLGRGVTKLYPILGRILVHIQDNPGVYKILGLQSFQEFCDTYVEPKFGISKGTRIRAMSLARDFASLSGEEVANIGIVNLMDLKKTFNGGESQPEVQKLIQAYREDPGPDTKKEFRRKMEEAGIESGRALISIWTSPEINEAWQAFKKRPEIRAYCGSEVEGVILLRMMEESLGEWIIKGDRMRTEAQENQQVNPWGNQS